MQANADQLSEQHVEENPYKPGPANARLKGSGVSVWVIAAYCTNGTLDVERVTREYRLPPEAVAAALAYYERHRAAIDARIAEYAA